MNLVSVNPICILPGVPQTEDSETMEQVCPYCGIKAILIWVHSHLQCQNCRTVIEPCCNGENNRNMTISCTGFKHYNKIYWERDLPPI